MARINLKPLLVFMGLLCIWQAVVILFNLPSYILPGPQQVIMSLIENAKLLWSNTLVTMSEMLMGLALGVITGIALALLLI